MIKLKLTEKEQADVIKDSILSFINEGYDSNHFASRLIIKGLISSYPIDSAVRMLRKKINNPNIKIRTNPQISNGEVIKDIIIMIPLKYKTNKLFNLIKGIVNTYGYFKCYNPEKFNISQYQDYYILIFEAKYTQNISDFVFKNCHYLYHTTSIANFSKIMEKGLIPYGNDEEDDNNATYLYPDRIYAMKGNPNELNRQQIRALERIQNAHLNVPENVLLKIDVSKLPHNINFYNDPKTEGGVFTPDNIPPYAISLAVKNKYIEG